MKRLILCRHAKSSWKDLSLADHDRSLNKRGKKNAPIMGQRLLECGAVPEHIISSSAKRAVRTAVIISKVIGFPEHKIEIHKKLYGASASDIIQFVNNLDSMWSSVMLVGHNPEFTMLTNWLGGVHIENVPTCGIVGLDFEAEHWREVQEGNGKLVFFEYPKKLNI